MSCDNDDERQHNNFGSNKESDEVSKTYPDCNDGDTYYTSDWEVVHTATANNSETEYDKILSGGSKHWNLHSWFTNSPDTLVDESCYRECDEKYDCPEAYPALADFRISHKSDNSTSQYEFKDPIPNGDEDDGGGVGDGIMQILVSLGTAAAGGGALANAAATAVATFIKTSSSDPVTLDYNGSGDTQRWFWQIRMENYDLSDDFPTDKCGTSSVQFEIENRMKEGRSEAVDTSSRQQFYIPEYPDDDDYNTGCPCGTGRTNIIYIGYMTDWNYKEYTFESV
jgi:hypothetical protein